MRRIAACSLLLPCVLLFACGTGTAESSSGSAWADRSPTGHMALEYAKEFSVDYYGEDALITIAGKDQYLLVPEGETPPAGVDDSITILQQPLDNLYVAASSAMDLFDGIGALDSVHMTSTAETGWSLPNVQSAMENGTLEYVGKYNAPDYEAILSGGCALAVESTMIYHSPEIREKLETLGIPVLVEHSSYESHPLGRMEWIKLYGLLLGKTEAAESFFQAQSRKLDDICTGESTGKTVAFFYISSNGSVNVRKPGDYISKMIELAGGQYIFSADDLNVEENALSTMNIQMEAFYAGAKDADYLIYNSTIDGAVSTIDQLLQKSPLLADFAAVQSGNVWCTEQNMFQQTTGAADMIADLHAVVTGEADGKTQLTYLHRVQ